MPEIQFVMRKRKQKESHSVSMTALSEDIIGDASVLY